MKENKKSNTRLGWTKEEEELIRNLYEHERVSSWIDISKRISQTTGSARRTPKQCRQRYNNYIKLKSEQVSSKWDHEENSILFDMYAQIGSKWVQIAKSIPGRSENYLKNRFYGTLRKFLNLLNRFCSESKNKIKPVKYSTLTKILERREQLECWESNKTEKDLIKFEFCQKIRQDIILRAKNPEALDEKLAEDICQRAHEFNIRTRLQNMARSRNFKTNKKRTPYLNKKKASSGESHEEAEMAQDERKETEASFLETERKDEDELEEDLLFLPSLEDIGKPEMPASIFSGFDGDLLEMLSLDESLASPCFLC